MRAVFADAFYWIASINPGDDWHSRVKSLADAMSQVQIVTTDEVLTEVLTFYATRGVVMRQRVWSLPGV
jgi:uncharacterized protein